MNIRLPVNAFTVLGACDKRDVNGPVVSVQELNMLHTMDDVYHICNKKLQYQFLSDVDMKRKNTQTWPQSWYTVSRRFMK